MLDDALVEAMGEVAREMGQPSAVSQRLLAWLTQLSEGGLAREDEAQFLENVRSALVLRDGSDED